MTLDEIKKIIALGETPQREFKSAVPKGEDLARLIIRIASNGGGEIFFGVGDDRRIIGIHPHSLELALDKAQALIIGNFSINQEQHKINGKKIVIIHISQAFTTLGLIGEPKKKLNKDEYRPDSKLNVDTLEEETDEIVTTHIQNDFCDRNIRPCFGVGTIADAFAELIKNVTSDKENICVLGVFGKWGRGKTFFLKQVQKTIKNSEDADCFDFVSFNAWKYQSTPEIWAHLIYTLKQHKACWWICLNCIVSWTIAQVILEIILFAVFLGLCDELSCSGNDVLKIAGISISALFSVLNLYDLILKTFKLRQSGYNETEYLGDQHKSEKELERILKRWNWLHMVNQKYYFDCRHRPEYPKKNSRKVVLLVEDIDRCDDAKMISVLESLRLVMENSQIAKHLIVIVSVDSKLLINAIIRKYSNLTHKEAERNAIERMNKLFLAGITLPKISKEDMNKYVDSLGELCVSNVKSDTSQLSITETIKDKHERETIGDLSSTPKDKSIIPHIVDNPINLITMVLKKSLSEDLYSRLSPRQVQILFYRLLLANNFFVKMNVPLSEKSLGYIIKFSFLIEKNKHLGTTPENVIREMVVPYPIGTKEEYAP